MQHTITTSADGSSTLQLTEFGETYHSTNGAFTEAMHIYIQTGVEHIFQKLCGTIPETDKALRNSILGTPPCNCPKAEKALPHTPVRICIFDVGLGTALNCILLYAWQQQLRQQGLPHPQIHYYGIEKYPIQPSEAQQLNYPTIIARQLNLPPDKLAEIFQLMHNCPWEKDTLIPPLSAENCHDFILHKSCADIAVLREEYYREACRMTGNAAVVSGTTEVVANRSAEDSEITSSPAVVFYDTFSPATQPNLWDEGIFRNIAAGCPAGSTLVTYCSKGTVKQALRNAGFTLERLAGPPGKRHILRGTL